VSESTTFFFETQLGWRGLLAEALPHELGDIARSRPASAAIVGGICEKDGPLEFSAGGVGWWSGRRDAYDAARNSSGSFSGGTVTMPCPPRGLHERGHGGVRAAGTAVRQGHEGRVFRALSRDELQDERLQEVRVRPERVQDVPALRGVALRYV